MFAAATQLGFIYKIFNKGGEHDGEKKFSIFQ